MERLLKIGVPILIVLLLLPLVRAGCVNTTSELDRAIAEGAVKWEPVSGVIIERDCGDGTWEQEVIDWHGPGYRTLTQSTRKQPELVWTDVSYAYSRGKSRDSFYFRVESDNQRLSDSQQRLRRLLRIDGAKEVTFTQGAFKFHEGARIRLSSDLRVGSRSVGAGAELQWGRGTWSVCSGHSDIPPRGDRLRGINLTEEGVFFADINTRSTLFGKKAHEDLLSALAQRGPEPSMPIASIGDQKLLPMGSIISGLQCGSADPNGNRGYFKLYFIEFGDKPAVDYMLLLDRQKLLGQRSQ